MGEGGSYLWAPAVTYSYVCDGKFLFCLFTTIFCKKYDFLIQAEQRVVSKYAINRFFPKPKTVKELKGNIGCISSNLNPLSFITNNCK